MKPLFFELHCESVFCTNTVENMDFRLCCEISTWKLHKKGLIQRDDTMNCAIYNKYSEGGTFIYFYFFGRHSMAKVNLLFFEYWRTHCLMQFIILVWTKGLNDTKYSWNITRDRHFVNLFSVIFTHLIWLHTSSLL